MALATIKESLLRKMDNLEVEDFPNMVQVLDGRTNCMVGVRLDDEEQKVSVLMDKNDALPLDVAYGRMTTRGYPLRLRVRHAETGSVVLFPMTKAHRAPDGVQVVRYQTSDCSQAELDKAVLLIVAVFNKAAQLYVAA